MNCLFYTVISTFFCGVNCSKNYLSNFNHPCLKCKYRSDKVKDCTIEYPI